jgi:hypothetical protein
MSRDIPQDQPLADEDRKYLLDRGAWGQSLIQRIDENYPAKEPVALEAEEAEEDEVPDYTTWTKSELQAEIDRRNEEGGPQLDRNGKVAELVSRLEDDDAAQADTGE